MRNFRIISAILIIVITFIFSTRHFTSAASEQIAGDNVVIKDRTIADDLQAAGSNVQIQAGIRGDLAVAGSEVTISAPVTGYVLAAGSKVIVSGSTGNDLWAAGANVDVNAPIGDNAFLAGSVVKLLPESSVGRDAIIAGGTVTIEGRIERNLKISAGEVQITSEIGGTVEANVGKLEVLPGAVIRGDLVVHGSAPPEISPEAQVLGKVDFHQREERSPWLSWLYWWIYSFLALLILGFAILLLSKVWANRVAQTIIGKPLFSLLTGFLGLIIIPILIILLAITFVGIPLALILLALFGIAALLSCVFVAYLIGGWLLGVMNRPDASAWLRMFVGALILSFAASLPWVGWLVEFGVLLFGFGAISLERWNMRRHLQSEGQA